MSTFQIPNRGQIRQNNRAETDVFTELVESYNLDLTSKLGKIKTAKKLLKIIDSADDIDWGDIVAFAIYNTNYYLVTTVGVYKCSTANDITVPANWTQENDFGTSNTSTSSDAVVFNSLLLLSNSTNIGSYNGSAFDNDYWTTVISGSALTTGVPHTMHVHRGGQETLFVTDNNLVRYYNTTAGHSTVTLQTDLIASCVDSGVSAIWVGTYSESDTNAYVYEIYVGEQIDSVPVARNAYKVDGRAVLSISVINNVPHIVTDKGKIQTFNGAGFTTVASLPFAHTTTSLDNIRPGSISNNPLNLPVHPKGMRPYGDSILLFINTELEGGVDNTANYPMYSPSGVWEYSSLTGVLNHRYALSDETTHFGARIASASSPILVTESEDSIIITGGATQGGTNGLFVESDSQNIGIFITAEIESETVQDAFESAYIKAKTLADTESIELKYRVTKKDNQFADVALASPTTINTTDTIDVSVGDEVTVMTGTYIGTIAHITAVSGTITKSIELDTVVGSTSDLIKVEFTNFKRHPETYTSADGEVKKFGIGGTNPWVQYKVVMKGNIEVRQFMSKGNAKVQL